MKQSEDERERDGDRSMESDSRITTVAANLR